MRHSVLQIGEVAARAGVSVDAIRYYERRFLIKRASRTAGGFRLFAPETVERIRFIKQAQELGFSLEEIRELLTADRGVTECRRVRDLLGAKLAEIDERMKAMREFRGILARHLAACEQELKAHGKSSHCPVVTSIERAGQT